VKSANTLWSPVILNYDEDQVISDEEDSIELDKSLTQTENANKTECLKFFLQCVAEYPVIFDLAEKGKKEI